MKSRSILTLVVALLCATGAVTPASAATTLGYVAPDAPPLRPGDMVALSPSPAYTVPFPGVITAWTVRGGSYAEGASVAYAALKLFHLDRDPVSGDLTATVVASSNRFFAEEGLQTHITRISVEGGEQLGVLFPEPGHLYASTAFSACSAKDKGAVGAVYVEGGALACADGQAVNVSARLEADGDGDGFGDETQDRCPGVSGTATGCRSRYRGRGGGYPFKLRFGTRTAEGVRESEMPVTVLEENEYGIRVRCPDGYETAYILFGGIRKNWPVHVRRNGSFSYVRGIAPGAGIADGRTTVTGHLKGPRARGTVTGTIRLRHHGACAIRSYSWRARSG